MPRAENDLAQRILALPGVEHAVADEASGAPQISWGDQFFFVGADRRRPFATIVEHDVPGFDEDSHLDRPGIFRLNIELGRDEFQRVFGYAPAQAASHPARRLPEVDWPLEQARRRATRRDEQLRRRRTEQPGG